MFHAFLDRDFRQNSRIVWLSCPPYQVNHHDCDVAGNVSGGALLKMADEVAGLAASKHTMGGEPTTACMDAVDFNKMIPKG